MGRRDHLGPLVQVQVRTQIRRAIRSGRLPENAGFVLEDPDAFDTLCESIADRGGRVGAIGDGKILAWIAANLPWILEVVKAILAAFDIQIPDFPPMPSKSPASESELFAGTALLEAHQPDWAVRLEQKLDKALAPDLS